MKLILTFYLLFLGCYPSVFAQDADIVLLNGHVITVKSKGDRAEALAIKGEKIIAVGSNEAVSKHIGTSTRVIQLNGKTVVPGFNDVHQHPAPVYSWDKPYATLRLDTVSSMNSLITLLKRKAALLPKGTLITGRGYNEIKLEGQPTKFFLDQVSKDHPIIITHASGHLSVVNSLMLSMNSIDRKTQDPPGGAFGRDQQGEPNGIVKESASSLLATKSLSIAVKPTFEEELEGYKAYFNALLASGVTSVGDCGTTPAKMKMYKTLVAQHFPIRFNLYIVVNYLDQLISGEIQREQSPYLRVNGIKMFHGNSLSGKTCWLHEPYDMVNPTTNKNDYYGIPPARSQTALDSLVLKIHKAGLQLACHSNGDREIEMVISAIEKAQKTFPVPDARHRIEHCSITNDNIINGLKRNKIIPVFHSYINELGDQLLVYGAKRLSMIMPTRTAIEMDIPYALHSDYPVSRFEPMIQLSGAVNRISRNGVEIGVNQRIDAEEAIRAYTSGGAYTSHDENLKGKIEIGQYADIVVLNNDPSTIAPSKISDIKVCLTTVGGKIVFEAMK